MTAPDDSTARLPRNPAMGRVPAYCPEFTPTLVDCAKAMESRETRLRTPWLSTETLINAARSERAFTAYMVEQMRKSERLFRRAYA